MRISGVTIWYNPDKECVDNIKSYINDINKLYIIDNSKKDNSELLEQELMNKVEYIPCYNNYGIARALNKGCSLSLEEKYEWVLTMDQDSKFRESDLEKLVCYIEKNKNNKLAIVSPAHEVANGAETKIFYYTKNRLMTSGNLLNLNIYNKLNGFMNELFIDEVDHEMCYKILESGFEIKQMKEVKLIHNIGNLEIRKIFCKKIMIFNHKAMRKYFIVRNKLYIRMLYPKYTKDYGLQIIKEFSKVIFFESEKIKKIKFMFKGIRDYKNVKEIQDDINMYGGL